MSAFTKEIRSFVVVSQSASIRAAAETLNISAPALSRQLQILERNYGTTLLHRSTTGIALTSQGEALRDEAMRWLAADAAFSRRLRQDQSTTDLRLRIGIMEGLVNSLLPRLDERLDAELGFVELDIAVGSTADLIARAESLDLDMIVSFNTPRLARLVEVHSQEYHLGAVYAPSFALQGNGPIDLAEVLEHPLCLPSAALSLHERLLAEILSERVNPRVRISSNSIVTLLAKLKAGRGVGFLTWPDVCPDVETEELIFRPLSNHRLTESLSVSICRGNNLGEVTGKIVEIVSSSLDEIGT